MKFSWIDKKMPDNSVDLILTAHPYNIAKYGTWNIKFNWREDINNDLAKWDLKELKPSDLIKKITARNLSNLMLDISI